MASHSKQEFYRRLMKEKKSKSSSVKRIVHPLARYNQLDQLSCVVCSVVVKSDLLWQTHLQSKHHKEKVSELKSMKSKPQQPVNKLPTNKQPKNNSKPYANHTPSSTSSKRPAPDEDLTEDDDSSHKSAKRPKGLPPDTTGLPIDFYDNATESSDADGHTEPIPPPKDPSSSPPPESSLPSDFFDPPSQDSPSSDTEENGTQEDQPKQAADSDIKKSHDKKLDSSDIPEGFFDDPKIDAKKRNVEYKDPQDSAWESFQKTISKETEISEAIVEKGDEDMQEDRELVEVNEQVACYQRAEQLRLKQEQLQNMAVVKKEPPHDTDEEHVAVGSSTMVDVKHEKFADELNNSDDDDDVDLDELLDWRFRTAS